VIGSKESARTIDQFGEREGCQGWPRCNNHLLGLAALSSSGSHQLGMARSRLRGAKLSMVRDLCYVDTVRRHPQHDVIALVNRLNQEEGDEDFN